MGRAASSAGRAPRVLLLAVWFGLVAAFAELLMVGVYKHLDINMVEVSPHIVWMAPVADVVIFVTAGVLLLLLALAVPALAAARSAIFVFSSLAAASFLLRPSIFPDVAIAILAAGIGLKTAGVIGAMEDRLARVARRTLFPMAGLCLLLALAVPGRLAWREGRRMAALPGGDPDRPNVLLIILDTVRAKSLSLYGHQRPTTPRLEEFAADGLVFDAAIAPAPWTLPSHSSMFTGRYPSELSANWVTPLDDAYPTLAEILSAHGYVTAGFVANYLYTSYVHGIDRGFVHYEDYPVSAGQAFLSSSIGLRLATSTRLRALLGHHELLNRKTAADVGRGFLRWLDGRDERPFFAFLNYFDAHEPYLPPAPYDSIFGPVGPRHLWHYGGLHLGTRALRPEKWAMTPEERQIDLNAYEASIAYVDAQLGVLFDELARRGVLENTLVIVTSDHGEQHGEHGIYRHMNTVYMPVIHVPLLVVFPGRVPRGGRVAAPVSLRDIAATVLDLTGVDAAETVPGRSLGRYWRGPVEPSAHAEYHFSELRPSLVARDWYPVARGTMHSVIRGRYHYIREGDGTERLFDLETDAAEERDLAGAAGMSPVVSEFRKVLDGILRYGSAAESERIATGVPARLDRQGDGRR